MHPDNKSFRRGDLIWSENPWAYALHVKSSAEFCAECLVPAQQRPLSRCSKCKRVFYCNKKCQKSHWSTHKVECHYTSSSDVFPAATIRILLQIIMAKDNTDTEFLNSLISHEDQLIADNESKLVMEQAYAMFMVYSKKEISVPPEVFFHFFGVIKVNSFHLTDAYGHEIGVALYKKSAKLDHSCLPNADFAFVGKQLRLIATDSIPDTSKIRISYVDLLMPTEVRRRGLLSGYFFSCDCPRCLATQQDFDARIPPCCGARMEESTKIPLEDGSAVVPWPSEDNRLLPNLVRPAVVAPEKVYVCGKCRKVYNAAVFEALENRCCAIDSLRDAMQLYRACARSNEASAEEGRNEYLRLLYRHTDSLLLLRVCRVMVMTYKVDEENLRADELDLMLEVGLRLARCFDSSVSDATGCSVRSLSGHLFVCSLACALLALLSTAIFGVQERLSAARGSGGGDEGSGLSLERLQAYVDGFTRVAVVAAPSIRTFASHLPDVADQWGRLKRFAADLNVQI